METNFGGRINFLSNIMRREVEKLDAMKSMEKVSGTNGFILVYIYDHKDKPVYQKDIEHNFGITRSTASKVISLMEKKEMIERISVSKDARMKQLCLTEKAKQIVADVKAALNGFEAKLSSGISEDEKTILDKVLKQMEENLAYGRSNTCER